MTCQLNSESEYESELKVIRECDIFNDDSAEIIEIKKTQRHHDYNFYIYNFIIFIFSFSFLFKSMHLNGFMDKII